MAYFPAVGRLNCESSSSEHLGFWQMDGYGIMSIYKSDWDRFGGECIIHNVMSLVIFVSGVGRRGSLKGNKCINFFFTCLDQNRFVV